jgi:hypothetical protein
MTYYPDLSPYELVARDDDDYSDLNVGWLEGDHAYPTEVPDRRLVDALLHCALRPARLCRGYHVCDLGCTQSTDQGMLVVDYRERPVELGNGEVRVTGPDARQYAAPTLVAHYVAAHGYAPPSAFAHGVMRRAKEVFVLRGEQVRQLGMSSVPERFALCLDAVKTLHAQHPDAWLEDVISLATALMPTLDSRTASPDDAPSTRLWELVYGDDREDREDPITVAARGLHGIFRSAQLGERYASEAALNSAVNVLEHVHDAGLLGWREDMRPSPWDERSW